MATPLSAPPASSSAEPPALLRSAFEWIPIGVLIVSEDGAIAMVNRELERAFGYSAAELIGNSVEVLVPATARLAHTELRREFIERASTYIMGEGRELFGRRKDGAEIPVEVRLTPIASGSFRFVVASVVDLSERRRLEDRIRLEREELLQFEALVGELGAEFVHLHADDVDRTIHEALGRVVRSLNPDRSSLFQIDEESGDFVCSHQWTRPGLATPPSRISASRDFPWQLERIRSGEAVSFVTRDDVPDPIDRDTLRRFGTSAGVTVPLIRNGRAWAAMSVATGRAVQGWTPEVISRLHVVALLFANVLARKHSDDSLRRTLADIAMARERLRDENAYLRQQLKTLSGASSIVGNSPAFRQVLEQVRHVATTDSPVLLRGETGTGKALLASRIHELSARRDRPLVRISCATLSVAAIEGELFAAPRQPLVDVAHRSGLLELARGSTALLDEVGDLSPDAQASLSRLLTDHHSRRRNTADAMADVRLIATTHRDLERAIVDNTFRQDLYYHLNVFPIDVLPLRERREDIPLLVWRFVDEFSETYGKPVDAIDKESMATLQQYSWPGNARELRNVVERAVIVATGRQLRMATPTLTDTRTETLAVVEREHIAAILARCSGRIEGKDGAAARLGLTSRALRARMQALGLRM